MLHSVAYFDSIRTGISALGYTLPVPILLGALVVPVKLDTIHGFLLLAALILMNAQLVILEL